MRAGAGVSVHGREVTGDCHCVNAADAVGGGPGELLAWTSDRRTAALRRLGVRA